MLFKRWFLRKEVVTDISHFEVQGVYLAKKLLGGRGGGEEKRKLCEKNDFEKKKKKPGLRFNPGLALIFFRTAGLYLSLS